MTPPRSGIVTTLHVRDGEAVAEGDLLAFITTEQRLAEGGIVDARILAAVAAERQYLRQRLERLNESEPLQAASLRQRIAGLTVQLDELTQDRASRAQALKLARESLAVAVALAAQGIYSAEQRRQREQAMLALEQSVIELKSQMANMESQRADLALQLLRLPVDIAQSRSEILRALAAIEQREADVGAQNGFALIARTAGVVTALQTQIGAPVDAARPLMAIIPHGSVLQAELYVPSRAMGFVQAGHRVRLLFDAFPYTRFGPGFGTVTELSTTVLRPEEVTAALKITEPVYRLVVRLHDTAMQAYGKRLPLQSGMALTADILLEDRTFLDLLLDPLRAAAGRTLGS
ncbi:MAG: HlyD family efflux transporter periplasmic adaptor subunit [Alphaproteobacteria bacterium]|nr:HlyD family efflux transporter periplasmic adaptor subunit [Alphaproteobacteria bacterium]